MGFAARGYPYQVLTWSKGTRHQLRRSNLLATPGAWADKLGELSGKGERHGPCWFTCNVAVCAER